jgi:hypothetical protein
MENLIPLIENCKPITEDRLLEMARPYGVPKFFKFLHRHFDYEGAAVDGVYHLKRKPF